MMARAMYPGMEELVSVSLMFYRRGGDNLEEAAKNRWRFLPDDPSELKGFELQRPHLLEGIDTLDPTGNGFTIAPEIYQLSDPSSKESSVPILFDKKTKRVVSNESADIVRMFAMQSGAFDESRLHEIDALNARVYQDINNGTVRVFRQRFALEDAIGSHACSLEASNRVTNAIPLGCPLPLTIWHWKLRHNTLKVLTALASRATRPHTKKLSENISEHLTGSTTS
jgi:glutathionyl-hydroquinone reductase